MGVKIHREGVNIILAFALILVVINIPIYLFVASWVAKGIVWGISLTDSYRADSGSCAKPCV